jgi:GNAT superfamily N-acetyltransferase
MEIRPATPQDIDAIIALGARMHSESPRFSKLSYNGEKVRGLMTMAMQDQRYLVLVAESDGELLGGFAGFMAPHWFSDDEVASDLALFVKPDRRGGMAGVRLVKAFVAWAKPRNPKLIQLGISTGVLVEETAQLYRAIGLKQFGYLFEV